jgi:hypothetical protein
LTPLFSHLAGDRGEGPAHAGLGAHARPLEEGAAVAHREVGGLEADVHDADLLLQGLAVADCAGVGGLG